MLDVTTIANATNVFRATDPAQVLYRGLLAGYSDAELMLIESEIGNFDRTGLLPESVRSLIDSVESEAA